MKSINFKNYLPHLIAVIIFAAISLAYLSPLLDGKKLDQSDVTKFDGMSKEIADYRAATGKEPLWTNSMFGGMPAFQISVLYTTNIANKISELIQKFIPYTADMIFIYLIGFYILLLVLGVSPWMSIVGAIAFAFSSYHFIIITAGHTSKAYAIGYMAPTLAGIILTFRGKYLAGGALTALFLALELAANHLQITYYFLFILFFWGLGEITFKILEKDFKSIYKTIGVLIISAMIAIGVNFANIWSTYEYAKQTIRGKSELTISTEGLGKENKTSGLDKDYATSWSYGVAETFSLMIPNIKGGGNAAIGNTKSALNNVDNRLKNDIAQQDQYWGDQPGTSGPVYMGSIIIFLFILALLTEKNKIKWFLLAAIILSITLSWGKNFMPLSDFFLTYFPAYNKFRAVSMTMVIAEVCVPLLAFISLKSIVDNPDFLRKNLKKIYIAFGLTGGLALIFYAMPTLFFNFFSQMQLNSINEQRVSNPQYADQIDLFMTNLEIARIYIFRLDAIRSFLFITLGCGALLLFVYKKINKNIFIAALGILILVDMWSIDKRYLNDDNFSSKKQVRNAFEKNAADIEILKDTDPDFRVFNIDGSPFVETNTSYYHKSLGGYHGAKLKRYQEIINLYLGGKEKINVSVLNMLNTKYVIRRTENGPVALRNPGALGNAWFIKHISIVENADQEILALKEFNPADTVIIDKRYNTQLNGFTINFDSTAHIRLTEYKPNKLTYASSATKPQLAVFSEIYYEPGWDVTINGKSSDLIRVNYLLRGMVVPAGENTIVFEFKPKSYFIGQKISLASSILLVLFLIAALISNLKFKLRAKA